MFRCLSEAFSSPGWKIPALSACLQKRDAPAHSASFWLSSGFAPMSFLCGALPTSFPVFMLCYPPKIASFCLTVWSRVFKINLPGKTDQQWELQGKQPPVLYFLPYVALELLRRCIFHNRNIYRNCNETGDYNWKILPRYLENSWTNITVPHY